MNQKRKQRVSNKLVLLTILSLELKRLLQKRNFLLENFEFIEGIKSLFQLKNYENLYILGSTSWREFMSNTNEIKEFDAVIIGAGFAGIYQLLKLRRLGLNAVILEKADQVGGTWHWNRYPGARCDIPSLEYSYQFDENLQQEWNWTEKYSAQPEILEY